MAGKQSNSAFRVRLAGFAIALCLGVALLGVYRLVMFTGPMLLERLDYAHPRQSEQGLVLYDQALDYYRAGDFDDAKDTLTKAFNSLVGESGAVPPGQEELAGQIQFMLGVVNEHQKQFQMAISAYEESLRHRPNNLPCKYNLERLKSQNPDGGGGGAGQPDNKPNSGADKNKKKGI